MIDTTIIDKIIIGRVEPHIYAFSTNTIPDYLKVGDTYRPVFERLAEWKKYFPNLEKQFEGSAKINDDVYFRDMAVHSYLEGKGRRRLSADELDEGIYYSREFFKDATPADVGEAIEDIRGDYAAKSQRYQFYNAQQRLPEMQTFERTDNYPLRPNQKEVVKNFKNAVKNGRTNLLMYAVMRFGKSFTAMCCAVEIGAKLVVVVSAKADVKLEWKKTVESHKKFEGYKFFTSNDLKRDQNKISETLSGGEKVVCFLTLQDLQGEKVKERHKEIFERQIDLLLVDESHYGARAEEYGKVLQGTGYKKDIKYAGDQDDFVETEEADKIVKVLKAKVTIHLSGTPYRILMGSEFKKEDIIAFFQFTDIVKAKREWDDEHILNDSCNEWDNPYYGFPQMVRFAFNPSEAARKRLEELKKNRITYAFSALFEPRSIKKNKEGLHKKFKYEQEVLELFEVIDGSKDDEELFGFLNYDKIKQGNMCKHIVVVLPYCASCDALEQLIKDNYDRFKNLNEYEIINISGVENNKRYKKTADVKKAIRVCEQKGKRTITLTVNRMLTGSTVPEWDTMIYLKDTSSPQEYDQAIFRLQSQFVKTYADGEKSIKLDKKPQTLLVDLDPNRMFYMQEQKSLIYNVNVDKGGNTELSERIRNELEISPIITINKGKVERVEANDILTAVSDYQKNKGIKEEALEIPVDMGILEDAFIRGIIERENEIGSKAGIATPAHTVADDDGGSDLDIPEPNGDDAAAEESSQAEKKKDNKGKLEEASLSKKIQSYYARILLYSFITEDKVISLADIIASLDTEDNGRIARNVGLNKKVLSLINQKINKFILNKLDYKIKDLNDLSHEENMTAEERTSVAVSKFGKLGEAIVVTPANICEQMVALLPDECFKSVAANGTKFLDIAGTAGEFAIALAERMKKLGIEQSVIANAIYTIPKSKLCYELIRKVYQMSGLNVHNIANFNAEDLLQIKKKKKIDYDKIDDLITQNKPFYEIKLTDIPVKGEQKVKFSAVVGNPPYQEEREQSGKITNKQNPRTNIFQYFQQIALDLTSAYSVFIYPAIRWIHQSGKGVRDFGKWFINLPALKSLYIYTDSKSIFQGIDIPDGLSIVLTDNKKTTHGFNYHYFENESEVTCFSDNPGDDLLILNPLNQSIVSKIRCFVHEHNLRYLHDGIFSRTLFGIESNFIEKNKSVVKPYDRNCEVDYSRYSKVLANDKAGPAGRSLWFIVPSEMIKFGKDYLNEWQVVVSSAHPGGQDGRDNQLEIIDNHSAFGRSRVALKSFKTEREALNFAKYMQSLFIKYALLLTDEALSSLGKYVPDIIDYSDDNAIINFNKDIDLQLYSLLDLKDSEVSYIKKMIKPME